MCKRCVVLHRNKSGRPETRAGRRPTRAGRRPTRAGRRPTRAGRRPTRAGRRPTRAGQRPTRAGRRTGPSCRARSPTTRRTTNRPLNASMVATCAVADPCASATQIVDTLLGCRELVDLTIFIHTSGVSASTSMDTRCRVPFFSMLVATPFSTPTCTSPGRIRPVTPAGSSQHATRLSRQRSNRRRQERERQN